MLDNTLKQNDTVIMMI